ncbi:unnamed protein product [Onchocerca flexuosa]|uniref:MSP domain-containing protein n=1 Tax=Onchocerca flexuosa TaxID=387005 RepID=A0A183H2P1_9BILA|nr:unnamed protein product [Onchocerca flexuosa]
MKNTLLYTKLMKGEEHLTNEISGDAPAVTSDTEIPELDLLKNCLMNVELGEAQYDEDKRLMLSKLIYKPNKELLVTWNLISRQELEELMPKKDAEILIHRKGKRCKVSCTIKKTSLNRKYRGYRTIRRTSISGTKESSTQDEMLTHETEDGGSLRNLQFEEAENSFARVSTKPDKKAGSLADVVVITLPTVAIAIGTIAAIAKIPRDEKRKRLRKSGWYDAILYFSKQCVVDGFVSKTG